MQNKSPNKSLPYQAGCNSAVSCSSKQLPNKTKTTTFQNDIAKTHAISSTNHFPLNIWEGKWYLTNNNMPTGHVNGSLIGRLKPPLLST